MNSFRQKLDLLAASLAIFAMFFGAGNVVFPLAIGANFLNKTPLALTGFILTAVIVPFAGFLAMILYRGQIQQFFQRIGKIPGLLLAFLTITLIGPLGCAPRCLSLAYSTLSISFPGITLSLFAVISCVVIFLSVLRPGNLLSIMGYVLSPLKISLLAWIIIQGWIYGPTPNSTVDSSSFESMMFGLKEGYNTMDLLASFFFAPLVIFSLKKKQENTNSSFLIKASILAAILLAAIYFGFAEIAYFHGSLLKGISTEKLLGSIAMHVLGPKGGLIVGMTVTIACLTTAIALVAAFVNFIHKEIFKEKVSHLPILMGSLILTFFITTLEFQGIAKFLNPILEVCYPLFIGLTIYNLIVRNERSIPLESPRPLKVRQFPQKHLNESSPKRAFAQDEEPSKVPSK